MISLCNKKMKKKLIINSQLRNTIRMVKRLFFLTIDKPEFFVYAPCQREKSREKIIKKEKKKGVRDTCN